MEKGKDMRKQQVIWLLGDLMSIIEECPEDFLDEANMIYPYEYHEALEEAQEALKKAMAEPPVNLHMSQGEKVGTCPSCEKEVSIWTDKVGCSSCLKKLNWEE